MRKLSLITVTTMAALGLAGAPNCSNNLTDLLQQYKNQNNSCIISEQCGTDSQKEVQEKLNTLLGNLNLCNLNLCDLNLNNTCKTPTVTPKPTKAPTVTKAPTATPTQAPTVTKTPKPTQAPTATPKPTQAPTATPKPTQAPTATPKPTQVPKPTAVPTPTISQQEQTYASEVVKLVNEERAKAGLSALTINTTVEKAALIRAKEIVTSFSHTRPSGQSFSTALTEVGASFRGAGENIAWGQRSPEEVMNAWMNSSGHRANILNSKYTTIGIGVYQSGGRIYWSQLFTY